MSQLLFEKGMKKECWQVIHDKVNSGKPFHRIAPGTRIHYDPETRELMWGRRYEAVLAEKKAAGPGQCQTSRPALENPIFPGCPQVSGHGLRGHGLL